MILALALVLLVVIGVWTVQTTESDMRRQRPEDWDRTSVQFPDTFGEE